MYSNNFAQMENIYFCNPNKGMLVRIRNQYNHFSCGKEWQRKRQKHRNAQQQPRDINRDQIRGIDLEDIAFCLLPEGHVDEDANRKRNGR